MGQWSNHTPAGLPCVSNHVGVYATTAKVHLFEGGNRCSDGASAGSTVYGVSLSGSGAVINAPAAASVTAPSQPTAPQPAQPIVQVPVPTTPTPVVSVTTSAPSGSPTIITTTSSAAPVAGWLNIPLRTWV